MQEFADYSFIDFGASQGGSLEWASGVFGGRGIGVDIDPKKVEMAQKKGLACFVGDATALEIPANTFKYATLLNFLEHLPGYSVGEKIVNSAVSVVSDFVLILGPNFERLSELHSLGFKKYYADWSGHTWHHSLDELAKIARQSNLPYLIIQIDPVKDSFHESLLPLDASRNRGPYDPAIDPPKAFKRLHRGFFTWFICIILKNPEFRVEDIALRALSPRIFAGNELLGPLYPTPNAL